MSSRLEYKAYKMFIIKYSAKTYLNLLVQGLLPCLVLMHQNGLSCVFWISPDLRAKSSLRVSKTSQSTLASEICIVRAVFNNGSFANTRIWC